MTAREASAFDNMLDMILTTVSDKPATNAESFTIVAVQVESTSRQPKSGYGFYGDHELSLCWEMDTFGSSATTDPDTAASPTIGYL